MENGGKKQKKKTGEKERKKRRLQRQQKNGTKPFLRLMLRSFARERTEKSPDLEKTVFALKDSNVERISLFLK